MPLAHQSRVGDLLPQALLGGRPVEFRLLGLPVRSLLVELPVALLQFSQNPEALPT
jgi:hypothetical protein